ncbi:MAG: hypothetical protein ND866_18530 [Pyrinomonadaceae bacterium]|nr:hypothetical protein [Pyrinomonadaceae bacterium]
MKDSCHFYKYLVPAAMMFGLLINFAPYLFAQTPAYPKEIRGYKVERKAVEVKKLKKQSKDTTEPYSDSEVDRLIQFGQPLLTRATPLGITLEIPIVVTPIKHSGQVDFLVFEDIVVNGTSVEIDDYHHSFDLPNNQPLTLRDPLSLYIYLPSAVFATIDELSDSKETWPVTGRVYVFGKFKKLLFSFKRCVPVEVNFTMRNPLRAQ